MYVCLHVYVCRVCDLSVYGVFEMDKEAKEEVGGKREGGKRSLKE